MERRLDTSIRNEKRMPYARRICVSFFGILVHGQQSSGDSKRGGVVSCVRIEEESDALVTSQESRIETWS